MYKRQGRLFEVYLSRQRPESTEVLLTRAADEPGLLEVRGSRVPSDGYDLAAAREMLCLLYTSRCV